MKTNIMIIVLSVCFGYSVSFGAQIEIPSSFNPVGSGARAIGRGGAFIAVADDATAASWNPGGLAELKKAEASVVFSGFHRKEDNTFGTNPEANGLSSVSESNINYMSATYPFELLNHNMVVSLSYQNLYDFTRDWNFMIKQDLGFQKSEDSWSFQQDGRLSAIGLSYCIRVIPELSLGITFNFWDNNLSPNHWEQKYRRITSGDVPGNRLLSENYMKTETYSFKGFNNNLGILWRINYKFTIGAVLKTPFKADIEHTKESTDLRTSPSFQRDDRYEITNEELKMPMSYGIGFAYNFSDHFSIAGDIYKTEWNNCLYKTADGKEVSPFSTSDQTDTSPTYQIRVGSEYLFIDEEKDYIIPIRAGIFYDPAPANKSPDNFYGFSLGMGFTKNDRFSLDIAYQYRFGNHIGNSLLPSLDFSQDVSEHTLYVSAVFYKF